MRKVFEVFKKDIRWAFGEGGVVLIPLSFSFAVAIFISFVLSPSQAQKISWQVFWIPFFFSSVFPPLKFAEIEDEKLPTLLPALGNEKIFFAKFLSNLVLTLIICIANLLLFVFFLSLKLDQMKILSLALAVFGMSSASTLFSFLLKKDIILAIVLLPLLTPLFISAVSLGEGKNAFLKILVGFDIISFSLSWILFDVKEEE